MNQHLSQSVATAVRQSHASTSSLSQSSQDNVQPVVAEAAIDNTALVNAFLKGAGIPDVTLPLGLTPELMETLGKLLATAIEGTIALSHSRALVKREANADVTKVVFRNNNPLKFFPNAQTVLIQMLRKKMPGFMGPAEAMQDAYADLHAHQVGVVTGMRATMGDMLKRLHPETLETHIKSDSFFGGVLTNRKAKLWDTYTALFQKMMIESQDDFEMLFGQAFLQAYEKQIQQLKDETRNEIQHA